jgi:hypothetical protein
MKHLTIVLSLVFASVAAHAYIPHSRTILGRLARNQGKGSYAIEQDVEFKDGNETIKLRERWIVDNSQTMRLSVTGAGAKYEAVYKNKVRVAPDLKGGWTNGAPSAEFTEPYFFARSSAEYLRLFLNAGILPASFAKERPPFRPEAKDPYPPEPLVRLGRVEGVVAYEFGTPTVGDESKPGVWIEQDSFLLRKLRFPSNAEIVASHFGNYDSNLKLAKDRHIVWNGKAADVHVVSVKSIPAAQAQKLLASTTLSANDAREAHLPDVAKEFYSRFR